MTPRRERRGERQEKTCLTGPPAYCVDNTQDEGEQDQRTADDEDSLGRKLVHCKAACVCPTHVDAVRARLITADIEGDRRAAAAIDRDTLAVLKLAVYIDLDAAGTIDCACVDYIGCHGYGSTGCNPGG